MRALARWAGLLVLAGSLSGCITAMELGHGEPLGRGVWEVGAAMGASGYANRQDRPNPDPTGGVLVLLPILPVDLWLGYGITDRLEVTGRVGTLSAQLGLKGCAVRTPSFALSASGGVTADAYGRGFDGPSLRSRAALIAGYRVAERFELDLAPQAAWPLDPARWKPELLGATGSVHYGPTQTGARLGLAVTWMRCEAPSPEPGETRRADYIGVAIVRSGARASDGK